MHFDRTENQIVIDWDSVPVSVLYKIERRDSETAYTVLINITSTNSYTDTGLNPGSFYSYKVYLSNDNGSTFGGASTPKAIVTKIQKPTVTTTLNDKTVSLTWEGLDINSVQSENGGNFTDLAGAQDLTVKQYDNTNLVYNTDYKYRIKGKSFNVNFNGNIL